MVDPALAAVVLSSVNTAANAASQEAGKQLWHGLAVLVRKARHQPDAEVDPARAESLAAALVEAARRDPQFNVELRAWIEQVARSVGGGAAVSNSIGEDARVAGSVVQARDIAGPITFR